MIRIYSSGVFLESTSLEEAVGLSGYSEAVVSVVGAGGKTTMIQRLVGEYVKTGRKVIVTTTTHMMAEPFPWFLTEPSEEKAGALLKQYGQVWTGIPAENGKMKGVPPEFFRKLLERRHPVLIEADGARRLPLKVPGEQEPVIPQKSTHVLSVYGLDSIGKSLKEICFRSELAGVLLNKPVQEAVTVQDIAALAASGQAGRKGCPPDAVYTVILNKADDTERLTWAEKICELLEQKKIRCIVTAGIV